jgi:hypothetical protein
LETVDAIGVRWADPTLVGDANITGFIVALKHLSTDVPVVRFMSETVGFLILIEQHFLSESV